MNIYKYITDMDDERLLCGIQYPAVGLPHAVFGASDALAMEAEVCIVI